ncbi:MAG: SDR family oxidoreductase [Gammaproteobacteria bacterium]|nr:SDR family oxidoreductase [Gammaproteobacteria bacterium]
MRLAHKTIWITGASSGVGEGMANVFHREGAELIISARRRAELERVKKGCTASGADVHVLPFDITDQAQREAATREVLQEFDRVDVLVNNAGIGQRSAAKDTLLEVDRRIMEVDFFGPVALTKLVLPRMLEQGGGHLVVTSSVAGKHAVPHHSAYCAAKHALHGYFDTLRVEHYDDNIHVTMLVIAGIKSNVFRHALTGDGSEYGASDWDDGNGMSAEECADRVVDGILNRDYELVIGIEPALQAMQIRDKDPVEFVQRMAGMARWMTDE